VFGNFTSVNDLEQELKLHIYSPARLNCALTCNFMPVRDLKPRLELHLS